MQLFHKTYQFVTKVQGVEKNCKGGLNYEKSRCFIRS